MARIRKAGSEEFEKVLEFYRTNDYRPEVNPADVILVAEVRGEICGIVRLCEEEGRLVLRGMRVRKNLQRRGIGSRLLRATEPMIGGRMCFCIPHRYLQSFYAQIGFREIKPSEGPSFLEERYNRYRVEFDLDLITSHLTVCSQR